MRLSRVLRSAQNAWLAGTMARLPIRYQSPRDYRILATIYSIVQQRLPRPNLYDINTSHKSCTSPGRQLGLV